MLGVHGVLFGILGVLFGILGVLFGVPGVLHWLEKGTPPPAVAVVTIMRYVAEKDGKTL